MKKIIVLMLLVICGLFVGCKSDNCNKAVITTIDKDYETKILEDRIMLITYIDEENGNVVYISYDTSGMKGSRIEGFGITSQPIKEWLEY